MEMPISTFEQCPNLRHLEIHGVSRPSAHFILPWHQIHKCYTFVGKGVGREGMLTVEDLLDLLTAAPQLRDGAFRMQSSAVGVSPTTNLVRCDHLQSLALQQSDFTQLVSFRLFFEHVTFPCLTNLIIHLRKGATPLLKDADVFVAIVDAIGRSQCPLLYLSYEGGSIHSEDIVRLLHTSPTLRTLQFREVGAPGITDVLFHDLKDPTLVPRLFALRLHGFLNFDGQVYLDMLQARRMKAHPFKYLELSCTPSAAVLPDYAEAQVQTIRNTLEEHSSQVTFFGNVE